MLKLDDVSDMPNENVEQIVIVGNILAVHNFWGWCHYFDLSNIASCAAELDQLGIKEWLTDALASTNNWGEGELDYATASVHSNDTVREAVARNGKYAELLSSDTNENVRAGVIIHLINKKGGGERVGNALFLNKLVDDESVWVRFQLARLGLTAHLRSLVLDEESVVACEAVRNCPSKLLDSVTDSKDINIRLAASNNPNATVDQLSALMGGRFKIDLDNLIKDDVLSDDITNHQHLLVRRALAQHGVKDSIKFLVNDADAGVREWLAVRGVETERLLVDSNERVRAAARSCALSGDMVQ